MIKNQITMRQIMFAEEYLKCGSAAKAARSVGYATAYAHQLMKKAAIREYIETRRKEIRESVPTTEDVIRVILKVASGEKKASELSTDDKAQQFAAQIIINSMKIGNQKY